MGLLDLFGLGQRDIKDVFEATIRRVATMKDQSPPKRDGAAYAIATMIVNLLADLTYRALDPRVQLK